MKIRVIEEFLGEDSLANFNENVDRALWQGVPVFYTKSFTTTILDPSH